VVYSFLSLQKRLQNKIIKMSALANNYNRRKISFKKGKGSFLYSTNGKKYLDFVQGIAVNSLGHSNPYLVKAIGKQSKKLWHVSNAFIIPEGERLAQRLAKKTFADSVIFQNSGSEATEAAIKVARRYFYHLGQSKKNRILCVKNSFHGRTLAAIYASGSKKMTEGFGPKVDGFDHFEFGNHKSLKKSINSKTAAIMVETVMGEGGIKVIPDWCLKELRKICNKKKILLILDEVQCGIGRSGNFFAFENSKIKPDIVPIAKGIGGGFPLGAVLMNKKVARGMTAGTHGSTFGGNPMAMSVGNAVLDQILKKGFLNKVKRLSKYFHSELNKLKEEFPKIIKEVRGTGFLIGLQLFNDQSKFIQKLMDNKLLTIRAAENVIRILPPLNVKKQEIDLSIKIIKKVCLNYK
jgi:acetylornithine/N-succinyldiaminopimelate aminotransferase